MPEHLKSYSFPIILAKSICGVPQNKRQTHKNTYFSGELLEIENIVSSRINSWSIFLWLIRFFVTANFFLNFSVVSSFVEINQNTKICFFDALMVPFFLTCHFFILFYCTFIIMIICVLIVRWPVTYRTRPCFIKFVDRYCFLLSQLLDSVSKTCGDLLWKFIFGP